MSRSQSVAFRAGGALCVVAVAAFAAALGHLAIDALGDVLLAHDTYDDIAHDSRTVVAASAAFALLAAGARSIFLALSAALGKRSARLAFRIASPVRFGAAVCAVAVPGVLSMEAIDARLAGRGVDDLGDCFGGSIALGLGTTLGVALAVAFAAVLLLRCFCATGEQVVCAIASFFQSRRDASATTFALRSHRRERFTRPNVYLTHAALRGPPLLVDVTHLASSRTQRGVLSWLCIDLARVRARAAQRHFALHS